MDTDDPFAFPPNPIRVSVLEAVAHLPLGVQYEIIAWLPYNTVRRVVRGDENFGAYFWRLYCEKWNHKTVGV
ncbi:hypothetical protein J6590_070733 [Homalodisca vitripennis]|nr:hypothetical protein J6590_070733 [Homalodisca vitripennis]